MLHTIRAIIDDDAKWRDILRGLNQHFRHQTVTGKEVQDFISSLAVVDLSKVFAQYLTTTKIPVFEYGWERSRGWTACHPVLPLGECGAGFDMPVRVNIPGLGTQLLHPTEAWQSLQVTSPRAAELSVDENFYVTQSRVP